MEQKPSVVRITRIGVIAIVIVFGNKGISVGGSAVKGIISPTIDVDIACTI